MDLNGGFLLLGESSDDSWVIFPVSMELIPVHFWNPPETMELGLGLSHIEGHLFFGVFYIFRGMKLLMIHDSSFIDVFVCLCLCLTDHFLRLVSSQNWKTTELSLRIIPKSSKHGEKMRKIAAPTS